MFLILLGLVFVHFFLNRKNKTLLLPSHLMCLLEIGMQIFIPILIVSKTKLLPCYSQGLFIVCLGFTSLFLFYRLPILSSHKGSFYNQNFNQYLKKLDPYILTNSKILFYIGVFLVLFVFYQLKLIPILGSTSEGDPRFFYWDPSYYSFYKYPYWIGQTFLSVASINIFILMLREKKISIKFIGYLLICFCILISTRHRGPVFALAMSMYLLYYQLHPERLKTYLFICHLAGAFCLAMIMLFLREGSGGLIDWVINALSHGSSFVDFHEFVESLDLFKEQTHLMGKTYVGDLLGFIPQGISEFRDTYRWKEWTKILFDIPATAGGYRLTLFGESYFNFGYLGVALQGALCGIAYRVWDTVILNLQQAHKNESSFSATAYYLASSIASCIASAVVGFYNISFTIAIFFACMIIIALSVAQRDLISRKYALDPP